MKSAHTVFRVPPHVERVPAYVRRSLAQAGPKVRIGCTYQPDIIIKAAVHTPEPAPRRDPLLAVAGIAIVLLAAIVFVGVR